MYHLNAEHRDQTKKAKQLRRMELVPASIYGGSLKESVLIQLALPDVNRFLSTKLKGSTLTITLGGKKYPVLFKEISREVTRNEVQHLEFQSLVADEAINSVAQVILINREKNPNLIQQHIEEIPYNALPSHLVEKITIDVAGMEAGTSIKLEDLEIAQNEDIRILVAPDTMVVNVVDMSKTAPAQDAQDEEEQEEAEE